eukprot:4614346-Prymnesium_polylepis.1
MLLDTAPVCPTPSVPTAVPQYRTTVPVTPASEAESHELEDVVRGSRPHTRHGAVPSPHARGQAPKSKTHNISAQKNRWVARCVDEFSPGRRRPRHLRSSRPPKHAWHVQLCIALSRQAVSRLSPEACPPPSPSSIPQNTPNTQHLPLPAPCPAIASLSRGVTASSGSLP